MQWKHRKCWSLTLQRKYASLRNLISDIIKFVKISTHDPEWRKVLLFCQDGWWDLDVAQTYGEQLVPSIIHDRPHFFHDLPLPSRFLYEYETILLGNSNTCACTTWVSGCQRGDRVELTICYTPAIMSQGKKCWMQNRNVISSAYYLAESVSWYSRRRS